MVLSVIIFGTLQQGLTEMGVQPEVQNIVIGGLLLVSVVLPNGGEVLRRIRARTGTGHLIPRAPRLALQASSPDPSTTPEEKN